MAEKILKKSSSRQLWVVAALCNAGVISSWLIIHFFQRLALWALWGGLISEFLFALRAIPKWLDLKYYFQVLFCHPRGRPGGILNSVGAFFL